MNKPLAFVLLLTFLAFANALINNIDLAGAVPSQVIKIKGSKEVFMMGYSVSKAGDVNGDGLDDFIIGATQDRKRLDSPLEGPFAFVIFGQRKGLPEFDITNYTQSQGFAIIGNRDIDKDGRVSDAGDVNGDGLDDILVGDRTQDFDGEKGGAVYVIFGRRNGLSDVNLKNFDSTQGLKISGSSVNSAIGSQISRAGDINGDGVEDIIIGTFGGKNKFSDIAAYVIFGRDKGFSEVDIASLDKTRGFKVKGISSLGYFTVSEAGDVNGDDIDDFIIGNAYDPKNSSIGQVYVIYGRKGEFSDIDLTSFDNTQGIKITKSEENESFSLGYSISKAGDFNGDGIKDIIIGEQHRLYLYIVFGSKKGASEINLNTLTNTQGFKILNDEIIGGEIVACTAGDINNDGIDDILVGDRAFSLRDREYAGAAFVIYGSKSRHFDDILFHKLNNTQGFAIYGPKSISNLGFSVSIAGDIDGDDINDLLLGAPGALQGLSEEAAAYVILSSKLPQIKSKYKSLISDIFILVFLVVILAVMFKSYQYIGRRSYVTLKEEREETFEGGSPKSDEIKVETFEGGSPKSGEVRVETTEGGSPTSHRI